jgi:leader peptidase (prepilin peptidase)/N-methyltransferase
MPLITWLVYAFVAGLLFGSFANVVIYRMPRGLSIVSPPSACTACGKRLMSFDLVPIASWLALRGRCRYCRATISVRYPLVELSCAVLFSCMVYFTPSLSAIPLAFFAFLLVCVTMIDADKREIPNNLIITGCIIGAAWVICGEFIHDLFPLAPAWQDAIIGTAVVVPLWALQKIGINRNAVKSSVMMGLFLGWQPMLIALLLALVPSGIIGIKERKYKAFVLFLCGGSLFALWFGQQILYVLRIG